MNFFKAFQGAVLAMGIATGANAVPVTVFDFGDINDGASTSGSNAPNQIVWFSFTLTSATYLDVHTNGSSFDTEIGIYSAAGNLVANDDDDGFGVDSVLSFGAGSGQTLGDAFNLGGDGIANGEDGALGPGTYYLALGEFNVQFNPTGFGAVDTLGYDVGGTYSLSFLTNNVPDLAPVPLPASALLLLAGVGGLGALRLRRKRSAAA